MRHKCTCSIRIIIINTVLGWFDESIDRVEEGLETEVPSKYHPCISSVLIEAYFLTRGLN